MNNRKIVINQIQEAINLKKCLLSEVNLLIAIADVLLKALRSGNKILLFGNGGSAADAQHIASELMGKYYRNHQPLPAIALSTNTSVITAIANDDSYDAIFSRQIRGLASKGDVAIGISTSGKSPNVLAALEEARRKGLTTVVFTGQRDKAEEMADYVLSIPSTDTARIQEAHITAGHIICCLVEETLFGDGTNKKGRFP